MAKTCKDYIGISLKTLYISIHFGTTLYPKKYMHAPRAVHACTFFNDNVNDDVNDFVIDTWLLSLINRKLACISLVCTSVNWASQRLPIRTVGRRYSQWKLSLTLSSSLKNIHRGAWLSLTFSFSSMRSHGLTARQEIQISASPDSG